MLCRRTTYVRFFNAYLISSCFSAHCVNNELDCVCFWWNSPGPAAQGDERADGTPTGTHQHHQRGSEGRRTGRAHPRDQIGSSRLGHRSCNSFISYTSTTKKNFISTSSLLFAGVVKVETDATRHEQAKCVVTDCRHERGHGQRHHAHFR